MKKIIIVVSILLLAAGCGQVKKVNKENKSDGSNKAYQSNQEDQVKDKQNLQEGEKEGWQTYTNSKYGFEVKYLNDFSVSTEAPAFPSTYIPLCDKDETVTCFSLSKEAYKNTNFEGAVLAVNVINGQTQKKACEIIEGYPKSEQVTIGGIQFEYYKDAAGGAGAGHWSKGHLYRIFYNGICFELQPKVTGRSGQDYDLGREFKEFNSKEVWNKLEQVLSTFRFQGQEFSVCTQKPESLEIGAVRMPISEKYKNIEYLGQLFTADFCGKERIKEVFWIKGEDYTAGSQITLKSAPSSGLVSALKSIGYRCETGEKESFCKIWILEGVVKYKNLMKLEPYSSEIEKDDCVNCG